MIFWIVTLPMLAWVASMLAIKPPREVLWVTWWIASLFVPNYLSYQISFFTLSERFVCVAPAMLVLLFCPGKGGNAYLKPVPADLAAGLLTLAHLVSEYKMGRFGPLFPPELFRAWFMPYLAGRMFFASGDDLERSIPTFAKISVFASIYAVVEALIKVNLINKILGKTFGLLESGEGYRMGLKRSQGAQDHPIFMGLVLLMLLPWAFEASRLAREGKGPKWWRFVPWLIGAALFCTVSRGPQISALVAWYLAVFFRNPKKRLMLLVVAILIGLGAFGAQAAILELSAKISKEADEPAKVIEINGELEDYSGTRHRVLLFKAYADYLETAGMWGFGNAMKAVQLEERVAQRFSSIDSAWVMLFLQRGYAGVATFILLTLVCFLNVLWVAWPAKQPQSAFCGALTGTILMMVFSLFTSWFSPDFGSVYLFTMGICARMPYLKFSTSTAQDSTQAIRNKLPNARRYALVPGHPPDRTLESLT